MTVRRLRGLTQQDLDAVNNAFWSARDDSEFDTAIRTLPAIFAPALHASLRQQELSLRGDHGQAAQEFRTRYRALFRVLHIHHHERLVADARNQPVTPVGGRQEQFGPAMFLAIVSLLDETVPADGPGRDPRTEADAIRADVSTAVGRAVTLPEYSAPPGSGWAVTIVGCGACGHRYPVVRATWGDLMAAPELLEPLRAGRINAGGCPRCALALCRPIREWICETPSADGLAALSTVWRVAPRALVFQPPPGTTRIAEADRILEIRFDGIEQRLPPLAVVQGHGMTTLAVAYTSAELGDEIEAVQGDEEESGVPREMTLLIEDIARKLRDGRLGFHEAVRLVTIFASSDWPILIPGEDLASAPRDLHRFLARCLVGETVARASDADAVTTIMLSARVGNAFLFLNEPALAEQAIERAEQDLETLIDAPPELVVLVREGRLDLLDHQGRTIEAGLIREDTAAFLRDLPGTNAAIARLRLEGDRLLRARATGQLPTALRDYPKYLASWRAFRDELMAADDKEFANQRELIDRSYSGDLANYAAAVTDAGHWARLIELARDDTISEEWRQLQIQLLDIPVEASDTLLPGLLPLISNGQDVLSSHELYGEARRLLEIALPVAIETGGWEYAGIQAGRLAQLCDVLDDPDGARRYALESFEHATRVGDHQRAFIAQIRLLDDAYRGGDVAGASTHLANGALEVIRLLIGTGYGSDTDEQQHIFARGAIRLLGAGADPEVIAAVVEGVRSARTANAIARYPRTSRDTELGELQRIRETARLAGNEDAVRASIAAIDARIRRDGIRDERFAPWVDATGVDLATVADIRDRLARMGPRAAWLTVVRLGASMMSIAVWAGGTSVSELADMEIPTAGSWERRDRDGFASAVLSDHLHLRTMQPGDSLIISLPNDLSGVPAGALPLDGYPLCARMSAVCVHGFELYDASSRVSARRATSALLLGSPERADRPPLPGARDEVEAIGRILRDAGLQAMCATGVRASAVALLEGAATRDIVHVSCHADRDDVTGLEALLLAADTEASDSGWLTEDRIVSELALAEGCLVNLAGCRTAHAAESDGPLLSGLAPSLLVAGARCVIGSLWAIDDQATSILQARFYRYLLDGATPAQALADAQADAWAGRLIALVADPQVWAAFVAYGAG